MCMGVRMRNGVGKRGGVGWGVISCKLWDVLCFHADSLTSTLDFFKKFYGEVGTSILYSIYIGETGVGCNTFHTLPNFSKSIQSIQTTNIPSKQALALFLP